MNQFLTIRGLALKVFFGGIGSGFIIASMIPDLARIYFAFQVRQVEQLAKVCPGTLAGPWIASIIGLRNLSIACLMALLPVLLIYQTRAYRKRYPYKSGDYSTKLREELHPLLTMYSVSILFAYGFFVFGLFFASVYAQGSFSELLKWILYLIPHGILETSAMIVAGSTGFIVRDSWIEGFGSTSSSHATQKCKRDYATSLILLSIVLILSAFLEVYVSKDFMEFLATRI